jgi:hypothetical protein
VVAAPGHSELQTSPRRFPSARPSTPRTPGKSRNPQCAIRSDTARAAWDRQHETPAIPPDRKSSAPHAPGRRCTDRLALTRRPVRARFDSAPKAPRSDSVPGTRMGFDSFELHPSCAGKSPWHQVRRHVSVIRDFSVCVATRFGCVRTTSRKAVCVYAATTPERRPRRAIRLPKSSVRLLTADDGSISGADEEETEKLPPPN